MEIGEKVLVRAEIQGKQKIVDITGTLPYTDDVKSEENIYFVLGAWRSEKEVWK